MAELELLLAACGLATYLWRGPGVLIAARVDPSSEAFTWISCVAYAIIAGVVARMLVVPTGVLAETTPGERAIGTAAALAAYFLLTRRNLFVGVAAGAAVLWTIGQPDERRGSVWLREEQLGRLLEKPFQLLDEGRGVPAVDHSVIERGR